MEQTHNTLPHSGSRLLLAAVMAMAALIAGGCNERSSEVETQPIIRGMKGFQVSQRANSEVRRYPSVVQPAQESKLAFEVSGKLRALQLEVGQQISRGQLLAQLDPVSLQLKVQEARASRDEARSALDNASADYKRKKQLLEKNYVTQAEIDNARAQLSSSQAQLEQAARKLELAEEDLNKADLLAPFDGVVSSVEAQDYAQVNAGEVILGIYSDSAYETRFTVPATIVNSLNIGDTATITFSDLGGKPYAGHIAELGTRAAQVSAFPVVVALDEAPATLRAGMAAEVSLDIALEGTDEGFLVPLNCFFFDADRSKDLLEDPLQPTGEGTVFLYNPETQRVAQRAVQMYGIRDNMAIIGKGLSEGDIIAAAGVSYLHDGQQVKLLPLDPTL